LFSFLFVHKPLIYYAIYSVGETHPVLSKKNT
jgi:hypothetical protein